MRTLAPSRSPFFRSHIALQVWLCWCVLGGLFPVTQLFAAATFQEDCLGRSPAGIALQKHLGAAQSGNVDSMFCAGAIHLYVQRDAKKALPLLEKAANGGDQRAPLVLGILY